MRSGAARAQILVLFALSLPALIALVGLVADGGTLFIQRRTAQNGADAAALAGARALSSVSRGSADSTVAAALCKYALANTFGVRPAVPSTSGAVFIDAAGNTISPVAVTSTCTGAQPATAVPNNAAGVQVTVVIGPYPTYLLGMFGVNTLSAQATAAASITSTPASGTFIALNPTMCRAFYVTGGARLTVQSGGVRVNSSCPTDALHVDNNGSVIANQGTVSVVGGASVTGGSTVSPAPVSGSPITDPMASLAIPTVTGLSTFGAVSCTAPTTTLNPGIYSSVNTSSNCNLVLTPGNYIIGSASGSFSLNGGSVTLGSSVGNTTIVLTHGMSIQNGETLSGSNVLFYNSCVAYSSRLPGGCSTSDTFGTLSFGGGISMSNVTPQATGLYQNMTFFQDRANTAAMTINNGATLHAGTVYGASMPVTFAGGATVPVQFVADSFNMSNGANIADAVIDSQEAVGSTSIGMSR